MNARVFRVIILLLLILAIIAMIKSGYAKEAALPQISDVFIAELPPGIGERCNHSATYVAEIPALPGWGNAYAIDLPAEPGEDVIVCTAFMWDSEGRIYHFGFDVGAECQSGFCVAGMDLWKHYYNGKFWFWWQDPPAGGPPAEVELWFRQVNPRENTPGPPASYTPTPTGEATSAPTPTPVGHATATPGLGPDPSLTPGQIAGSLAWLPLVQK